MCDRLSCPRCGTSIDRPEDAPLSVEENEQARVETTCPGCGVQLEVVIETDSEAFGVDIWIEDRRDNEN